MAIRRTRPPQPLAPHGIPGHLVEFVEALRGVGISVGPSETVDAGRVMTVLVWLALRYSGHEKPTRLHDWVGFRRSRYRGARGSLDRRLCVATFR